MADRKRGGNYKHIGGYIAPEVISRFKQAARDRDLSQNEAMEEALLMWIERDAGIPKDIHDYVARNLDKLRDSGVKSLAAIAKREALPTKPDFCKIAAALGIEAEEKRQLWELTYTQATDNSDETKPIKPTSQRK